MMLKRAAIWGDSPCIHHHFSDVTARGRNRIHREYLKFIRIISALYPHLRKNSLMMARGSLEVKLPTIWADGKAEVGRVKEEKKRK